MASFDDSDNECFVFNALDDAVVAGTDAVFDGGFEVYLVFELEVLQEVV